MKQLLFIVGLLLSGAGFYLSYLSFSLVDSLDALLLGLYFGGAFILMTMGLYMMLVVFMNNSKAKVKEESVEDILLDLEEETETTIEEDDISDIIQNNPSVEMIDNTMALNLFKESPLDKDKTQVLTSLNSLDDFQSEVNNSEETIAIPTLDEPETFEIEEPQVEEIIEHNTQEITTPQALNELKEEDPEQKIFLSDFDEARLIGIEGFGIQRILKKIEENAEVELRTNEKHGLKSSEIFYRNKSIGFLSKVDYNRMADKIKNLYKINVSTIVYENNKVATVMLKFTFKH